MPAASVAGYGRRTMGNPTNYFEQLDYEEFDEPFHAHDFNNFIAFIVLPENANSLPYSAVCIGVMEHITSGDDWDNDLLDYVIDLPVAAKIFGVTDHLFARRAIARQLLERIVQLLLWGNVGDDGMEEQGQ
jgi:hypothetical protein